MTFRAPLFRRLPIPEVRQDWLWSTPDVLLKPPGSNPTAQYDWPNPRGAPYPIELRTWTNDLIRITLAPLPAPAQYDWPNPRGAEYSVVLRTWFNNLSQSTLAPIGPKPFAQADWPNPIPYQQPVRDFIWPTADTLLKPPGLNPFALYDWPVPKGAAFSTELRTFLQGTIVELEAPPSFIPAITVTLTDVLNVPIPNLTGLKVAWWDNPLLVSQGAAQVTFTAQTTNASGVLSVNSLSGSSLTAGQTGWIEVTDSDGTISQVPIGKIAGGPITVH